MINGRSSMFTLLFISIWISISCAATTVHMAVVGDGGYINANSRSVRESISRAGVTQLVLPGDNLYSGSHETVWAPWQSAGMTFDVVAIGNHNGGGAYKKEIAFFGLPGEYYSRVVNKARFIVLNSDNNSKAGEQAAWLEQELLRANESLIFLVYHHPTYTVSKDHKWEEKRDFQLALRQLIWKHRAKITALLVGHDHLASFIHFGDLPVVLSGAVQDVRTDGPVDYTSDGVRIKTAWFFDRKPYWARLTFRDAGDEAVVEFIRAMDDRVSCTANLRTGAPMSLQSNCAQ